jgi:hypothetical protein
MADRPVGIAADLIDRALHGYFDRGGFVGRDRNRLEQFKRLLPLV